MQMGTIDDVHPCNVGTALFHQSQGEPGKHEAKDNEQDTQEQALMTHDKARLLHEHCTNLLASDELSKQVRAAALRTLDQITHYLAYGWQFVEPSCLGRSSSWDKSK